MSEEGLLKDLNSEQLAGVTHEKGPLLIVAGAGTGKTTVITRRIAWLIMEQGAKPDEILALTFTERAAGEMSERVDLLLPYGYVDLWISTFHSFCERLLREHGLEIGIPNEFRLLNQTEQWLLVKKNLEKFDLDYYRPLGNPTKFIHALLRHFSRAKDELVTPEQYLKYAEDLQANQDSMESTGGKINKTRKQRNPSSRSEADHYGAGNETRTPSVISSEGVAEVEKSQQDSLRAHDEISPLASRLGRDDDAEIDEIDPVKTVEIAKAYHTYQQLLLDSGSFDFGDLINYTHLLFTKRPVILKKYQAQFKHILVDEFQDTNFAQYEIVKLLAGEQKNLAVVGDDDQAIYRFRGASMSNILLFQKDYPEARRLLLVNNYRTKQNILDAAYQFIQLNNPNRLEARFANQRNGDANQRNYVGAGRDLPLPQMLSKRLESQREGSGEYELAHYSDEQSEVRSIVKRIIELGSRDGRWDSFAVLVRSNAQAAQFEQYLYEAGIPYQFMASKGLYTKRVVLDTVNYLKLLDNYHESPSVWRVLSMPLWPFAHADLVKLSHHAKKKNHSLFSVFAHEISELAWTRESLAARETVLKLVAKHTEETKRLSVSKVMLSFLNDTGYLKYLTADESERSGGSRPASTTEALRDHQLRLQEISYLNQFFKKVKSFEEVVPDSSVKSFLELIDLELDSGEEGSLSPDVETGPETVKIMTVHGAKGLEFGTVFIPQLVDKRFPSVSRGEAIELPETLVRDILSKGDFHLEEERRLFYVAMTRAKDRLVLSYADDYGGMTKKKPSRFLYELGLIEKKTNQELRIKNKGEEDLNAKSETTIHDSQVMIQGTGGRGVQQNLLPSKFSFTQVKAFSTCPYQYRFAHILKIPTKGSGAFSFGQSLHVTLQKFFEKYLKGGAHEQNDLFEAPPLTPPYQGGDKGGIKQTLPSLEALLAFLEESWISDWYESSWQEEGQKKKAKELLKVFHQDVVANPPQTLFLEKDFNLKITADTKWYTFKGKIDRIDEIQTTDDRRQTTKTVELIDYKTGKTRDLDSQDKRQLLMYQLAAKEVLGLEPVKLSYYYLEENKKVSFLGDEKALADLKNELVETVEKMKVSDFHATPSVMSCKYCDFREICEYRVS